MPAANVWFENSRERMATLYLADEAEVIDTLLPRARLKSAERDATDRLARELVAAVRSQRRLGGLDAFLSEYALSTREGVVLMCLAEALLRVPDADTANRLIRDKIGFADWVQHLGHSPSLFVNASTWALLLTGRIVRSAQKDADWTAVLGRLAARGGEPLIRQAMAVAIRMLGRQFVLGRTIEAALAHTEEWPSCRFSFDMLGEAAMTRSDADRYAASYAGAIEAVGAAPGPGDVFERHSVSVKLSALHPRLEQNQRERVLRELLPRLVPLAEAARTAGIGLTIDAEEADRLDLQLDVLEALARDAKLKDWDGLGLAVQAYGKRALPLIEWLAALARATGRRLPVRLVKGAYWDAEIKRAQQQGLSGYPVFTRKAATDASYLACARGLLDAGPAFFPMFATHNAHTLAAVLALAGERTDYEFQRLHGMGEALYGALVEDDHLGLACRIYAPVGAHEDLLAYLVRRLLENGANTSFVNRLADDQVPIDEIVADPVDAISAANPRANPRIPLPTEIFGERRNSAGVLLSHPSHARALLAEIRCALDHTLTAAPILSGALQRGHAEPVFDPARFAQPAGEVIAATPELALRALTEASAAQPAWDAQGGAARATILERAADLFEQNRALLIGLCVREAGKTVANGVSDVREAIDFLRYYAAQARSEFAAPVVLPGPTGERNELSLHGRGVFACISPWNFPVAIFTGQVAGALAAGNAVVAKPADQTPLTAFTATRLLHRAGVPGDVLQFMPGSGAQLGGALIDDPRLSGVAFTGSTEVARLISCRLAARNGPIGTLIAETGGQNAMIADSTALPEQLVRDVVMSAFDSAGQRCSALRVLFVQQDIAARVLELLSGAIAELAVGDPLSLATDVGPVIDTKSLSTLRAHAARMEREGRLIARAPLPGSPSGTFFAPCAFEIDGIERLTGEVFGPILHVVRFAADELDAVCDAINATGYGLTLGIHSRIDATAKEVCARVRVGNIYVNRDQIGAVVGAQPFGGQGLSGTGPKAGGPYYLSRFATERVVCTNTTAVGGNAMLLSH